MAFDVAVPTLTSVSQAPRKELPCHARCQAAQHMTDAASLQIIYPSEGHSTPATVTPSPCESPSAILAQRRDDSIGRGVNAPARGGGS